MQGMRYKLTMAICTSKSVVDKLGITLCQALLGHKNVISFYWLRIVGEFLTLIENQT